jgi:hypothetical protein
MPEEFAAGLVSDLVASRQQATPISDVLALERIVALEIRRQIQHESLLNMVRFKRNYEAITNNKANQKLVRKAEARYAEIKNALQTQKADDKADDEAAVDDSN